VHNDIHTISNYSDPYRHLVWESMKARPLCADFPPETWFPETRKNRTKTEFDDYERAVKQGIQALRICSECPLLANGWCESDTFSNLDSIRYGISAGLLPHEKRSMINFYMSDISVPFWSNIRSEATKQGIPVPTQTKREKPKKFYDIDAVIRAERDSGLNAE
jgi:hypothetical protein